MPLVSSGQISLNDVRVETSQSAFTNYSLADSLIGLNVWTNAGQVYAPINVAGDTSWSETSPLNYAVNSSMSIWYSYNHTTFTSVTNTASLYPHAGGTCYAKSMVVLDAGTTSRNIKINVSGSVSYAGDIEIYYGRPWKNNGAQYTSSFLCEFITASVNTTTLNTEYTYNYQYNSSYGQYLYVVFTTDCL